MTGEFMAEVFSGFISGAEFGSSGGAFLSQVGQTFLQQLTKIVVGNLQVMRLHNNRVQFLSQPLGPGGTAQRRRAVGFDKTAAPLASFDNSFSFQLAVGFRRCVTIDAQFFRKRTDGWKGISGLKGAARSRSLHLLHDLEIDRNAGLEIDVNEDGHVCTVSYDNRTVK